MDFLPEPDDAARRRQLVDWFDGRGDVAVAFSGGVDSSVVLAAASRSRCDSVVAVTAVSPSVAEWQVTLAKQIATRLGVRHELIETNEIEDADYVANDSRRCFHCKRTLYATLHRELTGEQRSGEQRSGEQLSGEQRSGEERRFEGMTVVSGTNADDLGDYRPGIDAGTQAGVQTPLVDLGFGKNVVRRLAAEFDLPNAELPASPCLASRIAYGVSVTPERLRRIAVAEEWLRGEGLSEFRVRLHEGELARIEVPTKDINRFVDADLRQRLIDQILSLGFRFVTLDLQGFSSGSLNRQLVTLSSAEAPRHDKLDAPRQ